MERLALRIHQIRTSHALQMLRRHGWRDWSMKDSAHIGRIVLRHKTLALISHDRLLTNSPRIGK